MHTGSHRMMRAEQTVIFERGEVGSGIIFSCGHIASLLTYFNARMESDDTN